MKYALLALLSLSGFMAAADTQEVMRPGDRYQYIGEFDTNNPFKWDDDAIFSNVRDWSRSVVFDMRSGPMEVEIADITIICRRGNVCDRMRGGVVSERRPIRFRFRRDLDVAQVVIRSKPRGFSVPPPRVEVYLETDRW
jgi:hypothetical protein